MIRDWRDALDDMVEYAEKAQAFVGAMDWAEFMGEAAPPRSDGYP